MGHREFLFGVLRFFFSVENPMRHTGENISRNVFICGSTSIRFVSDNGSADVKRMASQIIQLLVV